ncbi:hypothetical protein [Chryseolinea lacunae]|uniref:Uncharacterized protein n=1 Tax=Chryseolinea lacunae TaxID=2801331 RepID=A0ABS1KYY7_9BACT|nr:hypothetical protein [Chryseolinea lacunae]MBL0744388.1 hypothetical protein [Chryseolinea lacunae]
MNLNNGRFYILDKAVMNTILKDDPQLFTQYKKEQGRGRSSVMFSYVSKYNERHRDEIGRIEKDASVVFYRRAKKERQDSILITTADSAVHKIGPGQIIRLNLMQAVTTLCFDQKCYDVTLNTSFTNYVECSYQDKDNASHAKRVEQQAGEFYIREIESLQERERRRALEGK